MELGSKKILLVRNDNIGDLVCSIPAIQLVRTHFPDATLHLLVNSYNAPAVAALAPRWVDRLVIYQKTKHVGLNLLQLARLAKFYYGLRREKYDVVVLLVGGVSRQARSFARWTRAPRVLGYAPGQEGPGWKDGLHELEYSWNLATHLCGVNIDPPAEIQHPVRAAGNRVGIQITSRKPGNRWSVNHFAELARQVCLVHDRKCLLLWSPGDARTATHPGDDEKAQQLLDLASNAFEARPTASVEELIPVLQECRVLITPDGGAMHLAAAMGIRVVAFFGQSDPRRWRPWTPRAKVLQSPSESVDDISVEEVMQAYQGLID